MFSDCISEQWSIYEIEVHIVSFLFLFFFTKLTYFSMLSTENFLRERQVAACYLIYIAVWEHIGIILSTIWFVSAFQRNGFLVHPVWCLSACSSFVKQQRRVIRGQRCAVVSRNSNTLTDTIKGGPKNRTISRSFWLCKAFHKCNEEENAFPIFKVSRLVRVHTDSHHNGHNKMIFAVSDVW